MDAAVNYTDQSIPESLKTRQIAKAFYRTIGQVSETSGVEEMKHRIDDFLFDLAKEKKLTLGTEVIDEIIDKTIEVAKHRY